MINWEEELKIIMPERIYRNIEIAAVDLYKELRIRDTAFDVFDVANRKGYRLIAYSKLKRSKREYLRANGYDAINYYDERYKCFVIIYDDKPSLQRQRFSIMHEIGHILLGHKQESDLARIQANYFAAYALAPNPLIHFYDIEDYVELAETFNISQECAMLCAYRYNNWLQFGSQDFLPYENDLMKLFQVA
ncbi:MAG: ImmA/IrrE family metallo-endopeptidase [Lachnospiraceae bacterium]|nr:ImmA/IrrE family metallo-endopeptidase [Lachnospiraceae bacterium]